MKVFISYSHSNIKEVEKIVASLQDSGIEVWFDKKLVAGQEWQEALRQEIFGCDAFLYMLGKESLVSRWCQWEFHHALSSQKSILPVLLEEVDLPEYLKDIQYIDFSKRGPRRWSITMSKLLGALASLPPAIPRDRVPPIRAIPSEILSRMTETQQVQNVGDVSGGTVVNQQGIQQSPGSSVIGSQTNIGQQHIGSGGERLWVVIITLIILAVTGLATALLVLPRTELDNLLHSVGIIGPSQTPSPVPTITPTPTIIDPAASMEQLIIIAAFAGRLSDVEIFPERYIRDELTDHLHQFDNHIRVEIWLEPILSQRAARNIGRDHNATLVIWGQYDDIGGIRTFVEIMPEISPTPIQRGGDWIQLASTVPTQFDISAGLRQCLIQYVPEQANYLSTLSMGIIALVEQGAANAEDIFSETIQEITPVEGVCQWNGSEAYYWRGVSRVLQEKFPLALQDLNQALIYQPDYGIALEQRGLVYLALGNPNQAQTDFETSLNLIAESLTSDRAAIMVNLGIAHLLQNEFEQSYSLLNNAWEINEVDGTPLGRVINLANLGILYQRQDMATEALEYHQQALQLSRQIDFQYGEAIALENIGLIHLLEQNYDEAQEHFINAFNIFESLDSNIGQGRLSIRLGMLYRSTGDLDTALQFFENSLSYFESADLSSGQAQANIGIGLVLIDLQEMDSAQAFLETALTLYEDIGSPEAEIVRQILER